MKAGMKEDINNLLKDKWFALLLAGAIIALIGPIHEFAGVYSNSYYGSYDIAMMGIGISVLIIAAFMFRKKIPDYAWHAMLIAGLVFIIGVPLNEIFGGNGFYGIYETFAFVAGGLLISLALFGIYDKNPLMLGMLGAFIGCVVAVRYNPYDIGNWFFYAVMFAVFLFYLLFWCLFEPEKLTSGQSISIASVGILGIILVLHEMMWPSNVWSLSWFILLLSFLPLMIFSVFLHFRPEHPWMKSNWWVIGCITGIFILSFFMRAYFNFEPAVGRGFSFVGTDPYYHARVTDYVLEAKQHLIWDNLLNYPAMGGNPRPPLFDWSAAIFGLILAPFFGWNFHASSMYALTVLPALWGALTIIPVYYLTKEFFNKKAGVIAAFLIAIMPNHIQGTGLGLSDHDPMCLFFIVLTFFFLVKALKTLNQKKWVAEWRKGRDIKNGFGVLFRENKASLGYTVMAGFSILTVALIWEGFIYILAILLIYYILQLVINHMRHEDSLGFCIITLIVIGVPMLSMLSAPYFSAVPGILQGSLPSTWYIFVAILVVSILFVPTRDVPWVIVIPSVAVIGGVSYAGLWHFSPALATSLLGGAGYLIKTKVYGTIGEAQATDVNRFAFAYGQITFYLAMIALFLLIVEYMRFWKKDRLLMVVWTVTAIYMTMGAIRFMFNATPVFAILSGWIIWEIIGKVDFRTMIKNVHGMRGNKFYAMKKGVKLQHVGCALFLVFCIVLPNAMGAIDASIPYEKKGEYDRMIYDWLPDFAKPSDYSGSWYLGAHGQGFLSDYWFDGLKWLSTQDTDVPVEERPAFIAWWDYGFQCVQDGKHPTIADNFQNGIPPAGNFITAQNESKAISVLITRILSAEYTKHGKINDDVNNVLLLHLGSNDSKTLEDIIKNPDKYVDYVLENPEKCGKRTKDIADREQNTGLHSENTMYAAAMIMLGEKGEEFVVNLLGDLQDITGHSIRYFAADARMFPFSWSNTGIFYAPTVLSDQDVNDFFETLIIGEERDEDNNIVTTTVPMTAKEFIEWRDNAPPEHIRYASDYELKYKEQFYNSMFYKGYIGYSGKDIGSDGIPGLSPALGQYPPMPGWMMKHFRLVYLNSGLRILKYYEGAYVNGTVMTEEGHPVPNVYVTVLDDFGIPHDMVLTNETGYYSLVSPFGMKENKYNVSIVASSGNFNPLYKIGDNTLGKKTIHVKEEDAFSRKQIMLNFTIKGASMHGKVSWDDGETVSNGTVLLKTDTKTFTENISSNGEYRFDDIAPATYKLWLNTSGHEFYVRDVIPVSDTDKTEDITLKGRVSGNLDYDENANVTNANVTVSLFDETNLTRMNVTSNESYSFEKILPGKYTLSVDEDNYLNFTGSFNLGLNEEKTVNVTLQSAVFISGTTYNTEPMKNVTLRFKGVMNTTVVSDETGFYKLKLIPGGYSISSTYIDNNAVYIFNDVLKVENLSITKNVSLKKGERTYGYVCYEKYGENNTVNETSGENKTVNETLPNVHITFKSDNITVKAVSNSTGYYEVYLPSDSYTTLVSYEYNETSTLVFLQPFNTTEKKRNITLIEGIKVHGILHYDLDDEHDKIVENALILFESKNGTVEITSNEDGNYDVYLPVGNYNVSVNVSGFNPNPFNNKTFVNKTIVTTIVNETTNETVNTTKNEMWYNISLNPINITVSCVISSALLPEETINLTNVTVSFNASDDIGINNSVILNLTLNETTNQTYYNISLNPGNYNVTIEHNTNKSGTDVLYYNYTKLGIVVGEGNIKLNITVEKKIKINGTVWIDLNDNGKMDIINETNHIVINEICYNTSDPKAVWFELYNPTSENVSLNNWTYYNSNVYTVFNFPNVTIHPNEFIVFTSSKNNFTSYWNISEDISIYNVSVSSVIAGGYMWICNETSIVDSMMEEPQTFYLNHSWSRYRNAYDSDNFTDDFYDEINPTPGYENTKSKTEVIENATIEFITGNVSYTVQSDVNGTYEIYLKHGNYTVFVKYLLENATHNITYDEFGNVTFDNITYNNITYVYLNLTKFSVGNSIQNVMLVEAVNISGFMYYDENEDGIYDEDEGISANITFTSNTTNAFTNASITVTSNEEGLYQLYLPSGNYTVYVNETYGNANYTYNKSLPIPDSTYNISLEIDTIMVTGTVKYDDTPLGNVTISFNDFNTTTDENGLYKIYLPLDEYNVTITYLGFEFYEKTYNISIISNYSINATLIPSNVPVYGVTYYDVNDNNVYDNEDVLITNATISFTGTENINVTSNGCYNTILPIGEYTVYANYVTPWNTSYGYFGQIPDVEPTPYQQLDIALIRSVRIWGDIYYYNMTNEKNNATLLNVTFTLGESSKTIQANGSVEEYEIYLPIVPYKYTISASYTTFEYKYNKNITYSYKEEIDITEDMRFDINLTKERKCNLTLYWNKTENQTFEPINQGGSVSYNITITNNGNDNDTFALSTLGVTNNGNPVEGWNVSFSKNSVTLGLNDNETVIVNITASPNALAYNNTITIKATSQNDTSAFDTTDLIVAVNRINDDINIECDEHEKWISPLESVDFVLSIENNGNNNENDLISLTVDPLPKGWNASLDNYRPFILGESKATVTLTVTAPSNAKLDDYTNIYLYATLERNNTTVASNVLKAVVSFPDLTVKNITFSKSHPKIGESLTINATVCNLGNVNAFSSNGFEARFYVDDKLINTTYINQTTILVGENITMSADWNTTGVEPGWRTVKVSVGAHNGTLDELNNNNNYATKSLLVGKEKAWWKLVAVIVGILACMGAVILIRKIRRRR